MIDRRRGWRALRSGLFVGAALLALVGPTEAQPADTMQFVIAQPTGIAANISTSYYIYASGVIDQGAADRLKALVAAKKIPSGSLLFLNSPGGKSIGGYRAREGDQSRGFLHLC